jgi:hypothetical protein
VSALGLVSDCASPTTCPVAAQICAEVRTDAPIDRIESVRPALRFRVPLEGNSVNELEVVGQTGAPVGWLTPTDFGWAHAN